MALTVAELAFIFDADTKQVDRALAGMDRKIDGAARSASSSMGGFWSRQERDAGRFQGVLRAVRRSLIGLSVGAGVGAAALLKESVSEASNLNESLNAVNVTFGQSSRGIKRLGREAADAVGMSTTEFQGLAVQFSAFVRTVSGGGRHAVVRTMDDLTTRAADFASVMNLDVAEAATLFQSGLAGETEPLRRYGIDLSAAAVQAHAYKTGLAEAGAELTEQEKVQARYSLLMKQTGRTQGDFTNTSDELANVMRRLGAHFDNSQAKLGKGFLPVLEDVGLFLIDKGIPALNDFGEWFTTTGLPAVQDFANEAKPLVKEILPALGSTLGFARDVLKDAAPYARDLVEAFNDMPDWAKKAIIGGGAGLAVGAKLGVGRLAGRAASGVASSVTGSAKPVPVFVTNPGFGAATGVGGAAAGGGKGGSAFVKGGGVLAATAGIGFLASATPEQVSRGARSLGGAAGIGHADSGGIAASAKSFDALTKGADDATEAIERTEGAGKRLAKEIFGVQEPVEGLGVKIDETGRVTEQLSRAILGIPKPRIDSSDLLTALEYAKALRTQLGLLAFNGTTGMTPTEARAGGHAGGGYTGDGPKYQIAGPVHRGEFVFDQQTTRENRALFEAIHAGRPVRMGDLAGINAGGVTPGTASSQGALDIDYDRLAASMANVRPLYGDVHMQPHNYGEFARQMEQDRRQAAGDGIRRR